MRQPVSPLFFFFFSFFYWYGGSLLVLISYTMPLSAHPYSNINIVPANTATLLHSVQQNAEPHNAKTGRHKINMNTKKRRGSIPLLLYTAKLSSWRKGNLCPKGNWDRKRGSRTAPIRCAFSLSEKGKSCTKVGRVFLNKPVSLAAFRLQLMAATSKPRWIYPG